MGRNGSMKSRLHQIHMKNYKVLIAVSLGVIAAFAALSLSVRSPGGVDQLFGYGSVLALLGVAALEYRVSWKRVIGR